MAPRRLSDLFFRNLWHNRRTRHARRCARLRNADSHAPEPTEWGFLWQSLITAATRRATGKRIGLMNGAANHRRLGVSAAVIFAAAIMICTRAKAGDFSDFARRDAGAGPAFVEERAYPAVRPAEVADDNELRLKNNQHPAAVAPLPPAILTGSGLLIGNWALRKMFKRRWI
jgi:hypothetical protein